MDVFRNGKFELIALSETKLKGNEELPWCGVNGITAGVQEMERAMKCMALLLNDVWHSAEIDFGCVSSRVLCIKFKFSRVKVCVVVGHGPNEGIAEEMDKTVDRLGSGYRLCVLRDLNGWIGDRVRADIISAFEVP